MRLTLHLTTADLLFGYRKHTVNKLCVLAIAGIDVVVTNEYMGNSDGSEATTPKR